MINYLRHIAVFATVADEGSFRAAAKTLGVSPSRISETLMDLEQYLGVTLLYRTTRKLFLTHEGRRFYIHAAEMLRNAEAGLNELNTLTQDTAGTLSISLPAFLASSTISTALAAFAKQYPKVTLHLRYTDEVMDMLAVGLDLVIRVGWLADSSMMARKLGESQRLLVVGKDYLQTQEAPRHPSDLSSWDWIRFQSRSGTVEFTTTGGETAVVTENAAISVNSTAAVLHFAQQNMGLAILPEDFVQAALAAGELVQVLPEWQLKPLGYYAVWPDKSRRENLTLLLVRFLADWQDRPTF